MQDGHTDIPTDMGKTWCPRFPAVGEINNTILIETKQT